MTTLIVQFSLAVNLKNKNVKPSAPNLKPRRQIPRKKPTTQPHRINARQRAAASETERLPPPRAPFAALVSIGAVSEADFLKVAFPAIATCTKASASEQNPSDHGKSFD